MPWTARPWIAAFVICTSLWTSGCALTPKDPKAQSQSDALLDRQLEAIDSHLKKTGPHQRTTIYVGSAQHSQSKVFQSDILLMQQKLREINPDMQSILLSNQLITSQLVYPFATRSSLDRVFQTLGGWSKHYPINVVTLIATHGNVDVLAVNIGNTNWPPVQSVHIQKWLADLNNASSAWLLSACYSGSFVRPLAGPGRVILTAAAHNRNSFGCAYHDKNTYFIGNLLGTSWNPDATWLENHRLMADNIAKLEQQNGLPNSSPQINVAHRFRNQKVKDFIRGHESD